MFNSKLKKEALSIHEKAVNAYNDSYKRFCTSCEGLHTSRERSLKTIAASEAFINSIANTPKEFSRQLGEVAEHVAQFHQTKEYAQKAYQDTVNSGIGVATGVAVGGAIASLAPTAMMSIATTFGTASTGTAISALSGAAAQKAALAWIGRMTAGVAAKGVVTGAGMAAGNAFLALAGPIGWGVAAASTTLSLVSLASKNKKTSDAAVEEAKKIMNARTVIRDTTVNVDNLQQRTQLLQEALDAQIARLKVFMGYDYLSLDADIQTQLGTLVNNTLSLAVLLNEAVV